MTVLWTSRARRRLGEIHSYIRRDAAARAAAFCERLIKATEQLAAHPYLGGLLPEDGAYRQLVVEGYRVIYRLEADTVYVMTVVAPGRLVASERLTK